MSGTKRRPANGSWHYANPNMIWQVEVDGNQFVLYEGDCEIEGFGPELNLHIKNRAGNRCTVDIGAMTHDEVLLLVEFMGKVLSLAREYSLGRDERAKNYEAEGRPMSRFHRVVQKLVSGKRALAIDSEVLFSRPVNVPPSEEPVDGFL